MDDSMIQLFRLSLPFLGPHLSSDSRKCQTLLGSTSIANFQAGYRLEHESYSRMLLKPFSWGREYGLNTALKRAFYELANYSTEEEYSDEEESDSDTDDVNKENFVHQLDRQDLIRIVNGQKKLMSAWLSAVSLSDVNCALKTACHSNKARITLGRYLVLSDHLSIRSDLWYRVSARSRLEEGYASGSTWSENLLVSPHGIDTH
ncbi:hypothetical protein L208DRAFT_337446 [Tricholoma matsutake]|nr:hypothetical protein L208DRAFT_337446 [Tricholoma matsutake 945]